MEADASGVPHYLAKLRGHACRRARRAKENDGSGRQSKRAQLPESSPTRRMIDRMEGREEISARRTP